MDLQKEFQHNRFEQIGLAIDRRDVRAVRSLAMAARAEYVPVHDGFRDAVASTLGYLARSRDLETAEVIGQMTIRSLMGSGDPPQYAQAGLHERVKAIAFGWHWHVTRITVTEDDHRITFRLHPCGSGMRLIQEGYYRPRAFSPPGSGTVDGALPRLDRSDRPTWSSFMSEDFPIYCNHCSEMGHVGLAMGSATFMVEGWTPLRTSGICLQHTYKDTSFVPDEFYRRLDLPIPDRSQPTTEVATDRLFTDEELLDLQTHPLDKLIDRAERLDWAGARVALDECLAGWRDAIHDVYRNWLCVLWKLVHEQLGDETYEKTITAAAPDLFRHMLAASPRDWASYWSMHLRLKQTVCNPIDGHVEFRAGQESLLQPGLLPTDGAWFAERMTAGIVARDIRGVGSLSVSGPDFIHTVSEATA